MQSWSYTETGKIDPSVLFEAIEVKPLGKYVRVDKSLSADIPTHEIWVCEILSEKSGDLSGLATKLLEGLKDYYASEGEEPSHAANRYLSMRPLVASDLIIVGMMQVNVEYEIESIVDYCFFVSKGKPLVLIVSSDPQSGIRSEIMRLIRQIVENGGSQEFGT